VTVPTRAAAAVPTGVAATPPAMAWDPAAGSTVDTVAARGRSTALLDPLIIQVSPCGRAADGTRTRNLQNIFK
jgi:hypothetical protein